MLARRQGIGSKFISVANIEFVGRGFHIDFFSRNLTRDPNDPVYRNIINIYGQGGVGKTWLVRKYEQIAREADAVTAVVDTGIEDALQAMDAIARQFEQKGWSLRSFTRCYQSYQEKIRDVESDPGTPSRVAALLRLGPSPIHRRTFRCAGV